MEHKAKIKLRNKAYYQAHKSELIAKARERLKQYDKLPAYKAKRAERALRYYKAHRSELKYRLKTINGKRIYYHRWVMQEYLGRELTIDEIVHHKDGNKLNNNIDNLIVLSRKSHGILHNPQTHR